MSYFRVIVPVLALILTGCSNREPLWTTKCGVTFTAPTYHPGWTLEAAQKIEDRALEVFDIMVGQTHDSRFKRETACRELAGWTVEFEDTEFLEGLNGGGPVDGRTNSMTRTITLAAKGGKVAPAESIFTHECTHAIQGLEFGREGARAHDGWRENRIYLSINYIKGCSQTETHPVNCLPWSYVRP